MISITELKKRIEDRRKKIDKLSSKLDACLDEKHNVPDEFKEQWFNLYCELSEKDGELLIEKEWLQEKEELEKIIDESEERTKEDSDKAIIFIKNAFLTWFKYKGLKRITPNDVAEFCIYYGDMVEVVWKDELKAKLGVGK